MLTAFATFFRESSSLECSSMYLRAFQIATGSARFRKAAFSNSAADNILIISPNKLIALNSRAVPPLLIPHLILSWWEGWLLLACAIFAMQKAIAA